MKKLLMCWNLKNGVALIFILVISFAFSSCAIGDKPTIYSSDVQNATLVNPDSVSFSKNADETELTISWKVVHGAKGYEFTMYNVDDPDNAVVVGEEKEFVDGTSVSRKLTPDANYKVYLRVIGDEEYHNSDAKESSVFEYSTLVPAVATIPSGTDISTYLNDWMAANPLNSTTADGVHLSDSTEIAFELVKDGNYTMSKPVDFGKYWVTLRGNKVKHAKVKIDGSAMFTTTSGLKIKFIDFDCQSSTADALLGLSANPDEKLLGKGDYYIIPEAKPVVLSSCKVNKLPNRLMYENFKEKYCVGQALINDCVIELSTTNSTQASYIDFNKKGFIDNFAVKNCTFYYDGSEGSKNYFLRYNSSARPDRAGFLKATVDYENNTFYKVCEKGQFGNYNSFARNTISYTVKKNIFVDCGNGQVVRRILAGRNTGDGHITSAFSQNSYDYNGTIGESEDKTGTYLSTAPDFVAPDNVNFTPQGADQLQFQTGDPRWLPITDSASAE
ncbi:MAG: DUF4992 family lipoprotein [Prevotella sp.]|jgi:hypothetical protein|nr:DUF4992 family lipoprotein [Prevotella sp.]